MLTVDIRVNNKTVYARSAKNVTEHVAGLVQKYKVDTGEHILHEEDKGIVELAIKMLKTIEDIDDK